MPLGGLAECAAGNLVLMVEGELDSIPPLERSVVETASPATTHACHTNTRMVSNAESARHDWPPELTLKPLGQCGHASGE